MTIVRISPSGPPLLTGIEQTTDDVVNRSLAPGTTFTDALDGLDDSLDALELVNIYDEFIGGREVNSAVPQIGLFGDLGWTFSASGAGTLSRPNDNANYVGAYAVTAPASSQSCLSLGSDPTGVVSVLLPSSSFSLVEFVGTPDIGDSNAGAYRFGLGVAPVGANFGTNGIYFELDRAIGVNWRLVGRVSGSNNVVTSTIPFAAHTLTRLRLSRNSSTGVWTGSINGVVVGTLSAAQVSGASMLLGVQAQATGGAAASLAIDRCIAGFIAL